MGSSKNSVVMAVVALAAVSVVGAGSAHGENFSNSAVAPYWIENTFNSVGVSGVNAFGAPSVSGGKLNGAIPTDTPVRTSSDGGNQGYEDVSTLMVSSSVPGASAYYNGVFLGNLTGRTGLNATFALADSNITAGTAFTAGNFGGEAPPVPAGLRLSFKDTASLDPEGDTNGNQWWYNPSPALVTGMSDGVAVTLSGDFTNLAGWSDSDGHLATAYPAGFEAALGNVTDFGLSFGSGNFFLDGFGFASSVGGTGSIQIQSVNVPEPASLGLLGVGALTMLRRRRRVM